MLNIFAKTFMTAAGAKPRDMHGTHERPKLSAGTRRSACNRVDEMARPRTFPHDSGRHT